MMMVLKFLIVVLYLFISLSIFLFSLQFFLVLSCESDRAFWQPGPMLRLPTVDMIGIDLIDYLKEYQFWKLQAIQFRRLEYDHIHEV